MTEPDITDIPEPTNRTQSVWQALLDHQTEIVETTLQDMFVGDNQRFQKFSILLEGLLLDYSKNLITDQTMGLLFKLARECSLNTAIEDMFSGQHVNTTENQPALHTALRNVNQFPIMLEGKDIMPGIKRELEKMQDWVGQLYRGELLGSSGEAITDIVNIASDELNSNTMMAIEALFEYKQISMLQQHFVANRDGRRLSDILRRINPKTTLFILSCRSFTTEQTLANADKAKQWLLDALGAKADVRRHLAGISANDSEMAAFGISKKNRFYIRDWVGSNYSLASAFGLPVAIAIGYENYLLMLEGMHAMDSHFRTAPLEKNMPVILGLIGVWYSNFLDAEGQIALPFDLKLHRFPAYLQRLEIYSSARAVSRQGFRIDYKTAAGLNGNVGANDEHCVHHLLHRSNRLIPVDFLAPVNPGGEYQHDENPALAQCLAQSMMLMNGHSPEQALDDLQNLGFDNEKIERLLPHRFLAGNKPSNLVLFHRLDPETLGMLVALYEHKVYVQSVIWNINAFEQSNLESVNQQALELDKAIQSSASGPEYDASTSGLIAQIRQWRNS